MDCLLHVNFTINFIKKFTEDAWISGKFYFKRIDSSLIECKTFTIITSILLAMLSIKIIKALFGLLKKTPDKSLGIRPLKDILFFKDIVLEIHYAACYSGKDPLLIRRCKSLLQMHPAACNIPMYAHRYTPFLRACWNGCAELISFMIRMGANIEVTTDAGEGGIYLAAYNAIKKKSNDFSAIKILVVAGLDINHQRNDGLTALDLAALKGHTRLVRWLLAHGAVAATQSQMSMIIENKKP